MKALSMRSQTLLGQPMFKLLQKIKDGKNIINMAIGDPDFDTPSNVKDAAFHSIGKGETHYTSSWGLPEFVETIRTATQRSRGFKPAANQVLVTPGANIGIFYAVFCCCDPGDTVLIPDPGFPTYEAAVIAAGCVPVRYSLDAASGFMIDPFTIERAIRKCSPHNPRLVILNSPSNPTGAVTTRDRLCQTYKVLEHSDVIGYSDEIYARMTYDDSFYSIASIDCCQERIIFSNGFSKAFAMTGWRLGAMIAPPAIAEKMMLLLQTTQSCVQPFVQRAGIEAIEGNQDDVNKMMAEFKERRDVLVGGLNAAGLRCEVPNGAFYAFPSFKHLKDAGLPFARDAETFADYLLGSAGVACLPGTDFGPNGEGHVRLSYATSMVNIKAAIGRIESSIHD